MNSQKIGSLIAIIAVIVIGSSILGSSAAKGDLVQLGGFIAIVVSVAIFVIFGKSTWVLIPVFLLWDGRIAILPLPFSVSNLAIIFSVGVWCLNLLSRREVIRWDLKKIDILVGLTLCSLFLSFARNPVGIRALGETDLVGGRPYFEVAMAFVAYVMLCSIRPDLRWFNRIPILSVAAAAILAVGGAVAFFVPQIGIYMYQFYSGFMPNMEEFRNPGGGGGQAYGIGRAGYLSPLSVVLVYYLYAIRPPIKNALPTHPWGFIGLSIAALCALLSGFRGVLGAQGVFFLLGSAVWSGIRGILLTIGAAMVAIAGISFSSTLVTYPDKIQRAVSFLPGDWDDRVVRSGQESTDWRVEMWEEAMYGKGIRNKWLGDGFGIPQSEIDYFQKKELAGIATTEDQHHFNILAGSLHSGPLTAIRFVGVVGLILYLLLAFAIAVGFTKLWRSCIQYRENIMVGFFALGALYHPFKFIFIFGSYDLDFPKLLVSAGLLVLCRNLVSSQREKEAKEAQEEEMQGAV